MGRMGSAVGRQPICQTRGGRSQVCATGYLGANYLRRLDLCQLDDEQQVRIRRIVDVPLRFDNARVQTGSDETADEIAMRLATDPAAWLILLERPDKATRRVAAKQLADLLGEPIGVDPAADPATQTKQREQLRAKITPPKRDRNTEPKVQMPAQP